MEITSKNACRVCLSTHNLIDIFEKGSLKLAKRFVYCAAVQLSEEDGLPTKICKQCNFYLDISYVFRTVCEYTDFKLRQTVTITESNSCTAPVGTKLVYESNPADASELEVEEKDSQTVNEQRLEVEEELGTTNKEISYSLPNLVLTEEMFDDFREKMVCFEEENVNECLVNLDSFLIIKQKSQAIVNNTLDGENFTEYKEIAATSIDNVEISLNVETCNLVDEGHFVNTIDLPFSEIIYNKEEVCLLKSLENTNEKLSEEILSTEQDCAGHIFERELPCKVGSETESVYEDFLLPSGESQNQLRQQNENQETRVGRHVAKKNAGQPPKRYSPDMLLNKRKSDGTINKKNTHMESSALLENDLPATEPTFEESTPDDFHADVGFEQSALKPYAKNKSDAGLSSQTKTRHKKHGRKYSVKPAVKTKCVKQQRKKKTHNFNQESVKHVKNKTIHHPKTCKKEINKNSDKAQSQPVGKKYVCTRCNKSFPFRSHLNRHFNTHTGIKRYTCSYCNKQFINNYNLSVHVRQHTGDFPLKCSKCNRGFPSPSVLKRHLQSHSGSTPYECNYCEKSFAHSSSLNLHVQMHFHKPSFTCDVCSKVFSYKNSLLAHKRAHSGFKAHVCGICSKSFTRNTSLVRHMSIHSQDKKFKCRTCNDCFNNHVSYAAHLKLHSKFKCENCRLVFENKSLLVQHLKKHKETLKCEQCCKKFGNRSLLIKHLQKHVADEKC